MPGVSKYHVAAVGLAESGAIVIGRNIEFPGTSIANTIHAEQCMVANALHAGALPLRIISGAPRSARPRARARGAQPASPSAAQCRRLRAATAASS